MNKKKIVLSVLVLIVFFGAGALLMSGIRQA